MVALLLTIFIFGSGSQYQARYDYCKAKDFKTEFCKHQKKMSKYEK